MKQHLLTLIIFIASIVICMMLATVFIGVALYFYLTTLIGPIWASLTVALLAFGLALICGGGLYFTIASTREKIKRAVRVGTVAALGPAAFRTAARGLGGFGSLAALAIGLFQARKSRQ